MRRTVRLSAQVIAFQRNLPPEHRRALKQALKDLQDEAGDIRALEGQLAGYHRLRVGRFRIVLRYADDGGIDAIFLGVRALVYEVFAAEFAKRLADPDV